MANKNSNVSKALFKTLKGFLRKKGAKKICVFGSHARGDAIPGSDIDVIVEFSRRKTLLDLVAIEQELSETLGVKVNLLTEKAISPYIIDKVKKEMLVIHG